MLAAHAGRERIGPDDLYKALDLLSAQFKAGANNRPLTFRESGGIGFGPAGREDPLLERLPT